jgi:hypothetical protein
MSNSTSKPRTIYRYLKRIFLGYVKRSVTSRVGPWNPFGRARLHEPNRDDKKDVSNSLLAPESMLVPATAAWRSRPNTPPPEGQQELERSGILAQRSRDSSADRSATGATRYGLAEPLRALSRGNLAVESGLKHHMRASAVFVGIDEDSEDDQELTMARRGARQTVLDSQPSPIAPGRHRFPLPSSAVLPAEQLARANWAPIDVAELTSRLVALGGTFERKYDDIPASPSTPESSTIAQSSGGSTLLGSVELQVLRSLSTAG